MGNERKIVATLKHLITFQCLFEVLSMWHNCHRVFITFSDFYVPFMRGVLDTALYNKVCQWLATGKSWWRNLLYKFIVLTDSSNIVIQRMNTMAGYDSRSLCCKKNNGENTPLSAWHKHIITARYITSAEDCRWYHMNDIINTSLLNLNPTPQQE